MLLTRCFGGLRAFTYALPQSEAVDADEYEPQRKAEYAAERAARAEKKARRRHAT